MDKLASSPPHSGRNALIVCPDAAMMAEFMPVLSERLPEAAAVVIQSYLDPAALRERALAQGGGVCFLDAETDRDQTERVLSELAEHGPSLPVVILLENNDPSWILRCLRRGASEFLVRPFTAEDLDAVLARLWPRQPGLHFGKGGRVIAVTPAKGACGASTIACNLAFQLRQRGSEKLLLADLDPLTGVVAFLLKVKSPYSFVDALSRSTSLDEDLWRGIVSSRGGLDILPAPENPLGAMSDLDDPAPLIEFARQHYDTVIIDSATVLDRWGLALAAACDELLLVATNELPAVQAAQRALVRLERRRIERSKVRLVINRYTRGIGLSKEAIATALHLDVFQVLPSDYETVHRSIIEAKPLPPGSAVGRAVAELAARLSAGSVSEASARSRKAWGGILASLFSKATL
jgi:pilus assembly protein CpaE